MRKIAFLAAAAGAAAAVALPASSGAAAPVPTAITIDTGVRCVTEPCPSYVVIPIPDLKP